jgi:hypothetical protein
MYIRERREGESGVAIFKGIKDSMRVMSLGNITPEKHQDHHL